MGNENQSVPPVESIKNCHLCGDATRFNCGICAKPACADCLNYWGTMRFCNACSPPDANFTKGRPAKKPPMHSPWDTRERERWVPPSPEKLQELSAIAEVLDNEYLRHICGNPLEAYSIISLLRMKYETTFGLRAQIMNYDPATGEITKR